MLKKQRGNINQIRKANHTVINKRMYEILDGLLLGDGTLTTRRQNISAHYEQGDKNIDYLIWLSDIFNGYGIKQSGSIYPMRKVKNGAYKYRTLTYFELGKVRGRWYPDNKKTIPQDLRITPTILKFWYIGDGNFSQTPLIDSSIFRLGDLEKISRQLRYIGFKHTLRQFKDRKRIRISIKSQEIFFHYIKSDEIEIPKDYQYKFPRSEKYAS